MGSGKTTIFKRVMENSPGLFGIDLDELIKSEISEGQEDLGQAIERVGWEKFRETERSLLLESLEGNGNSLISLGGGSLSPEVIELISTSKDVKLVWIKTDFETCWERISKETHRPLVGLGKESLKTLFLEREKLYSAASLVLNSNDQRSLSTFEELDDGCKTEA